MINSYKAFYRDRVVEVQAETTFGAQVLASEMFKASILGGGLTRC